MPSCLTAIPDEVTSAMINAGAEIRTSVESSSNKLIQVRYGSDSYKALDAWISKDDTLDPNVQCIVAPTAAIAATALFPGVALMGPITVRFSGPSSDRR